VLPPGLYEAVVVPKTEVRRATDLVAGNYLVRFEKRTLDDIRALGGNSEADDRMFETAARVSKVNLGLYRTFMQPFVRAWASEDFAEWMRKAHPLRVQYEMFSAQNPAMSALHAAIECARGNRQPVPADNWLWQTQEVFSSWTETWFNAYRDWRDQLCEATFEAAYGSPLLQALVGLDPTDDSGHRRLAKDPAHAALVAKRVQELKRDIAEGGPREAAVRALLYVRGPDGAIDERGFNFLRRMREDTGSGMSLAEFKRVVREQFFMLLVDERAAVQAIPSMLAKDAALAERMRAAVRRIVEALGLRSDEAKARLDELEELIDEPAEPLASDTVDPDRPQFTKPRPPPMHAGRAKH
jgi:hypothetical protein